MQNNGKHPPQLEQKGDELSSAYRHLVPLPSRQPSPRTEPSGETVSPEDATARRSVLVVDDDPTFCIVMREILQRQGFDVYTAQGAEDALSILEGATPDIILTDIMMPEIDGITLIRRLRERANWSRIPTIVITAKGLHEVALEAKHAGANAFIRKPFSLRQLQAAMHPFLVAMSTSGTFGSTV